MSRTVSPDTRKRSSVPGASLRVVLGEDVLLTRAGIATVMKALDGIDLVAMCGDLDELRSTIAAEQPDVVLTDIRMPPDHSDEGIRLAGELRTTHPEVGVVVLSQHAEPLYASALFAEGSQGRAYLLKEKLTDPQELGRAIREVASGGALVDPQVVEKLLSARFSPVGQAVQGLTDREREILALIAAAYTNGAIASKLGITRRGVEHHINTIFAKLELGDSGEVSLRVKAALVFLSSEGRLSGDS
jgi:DNA-binding NarL/FixJ family response regulator